MDLDTLRCRNRDDEDDDDANGESADGESGDEESTDGDEESTDGGDEDDDGKFITVEYNTAYTVQAAVYLLQVKCVVRI